ncbi:unnamed protein product [Bursaphelenchus xylophilus]|uniref:(pine wood nematode) hypothetical protein n=1 Tax=Bursaphelenchus xylophilus TaxID=6326 RepID=A0A1I7RIL9_BURXY|nr:unnamed protein product [Bursaphelenchus xylophilus]CAG9118889.1 unnamed protein product [Bursaphelenchus xylophilus]
MSLSRSDIRKLLKYEFLRGANAPTALERINEAHGPGTVSRTTAFDWYFKFKNGKMGVDDQKRSGRPKTVDRAGVLNFRAKEVLLCVWWDRRGPIHWELMPNGQTITAQVYCEQLERVRRIMRKRRISVIFLHDDAKPHTDQLTRGKLAEMGWEMLDHPPYSPDISPTDFHLFRGLEHWIRGKKFDSSRNFSLRRPVLGTLVASTCLKNAGRT